MANLLYEPHAENPDIFDSSIDRPSLDLFLSRKCNEEFFWKFHYLHGPCLFELFNKVLGYLLICIVSVAHVPQIFKILKSRSGDGISFPSVLLMLQAASVKVSYCVLRRFTFSSWGESLILMLQYLTVSCLLLRYRGNLASSVTFVFVYVILMLVLLGPLVPKTCIVSLKAINLPVVSVSKAIQIYTNMKNKGTGQLSRITLFLITFRSCARLFTATFETGDALLTLNYANLFFWNSILLGQVVYYRWKNKPKKE